jgi:hypothetical protein
MEPTLTAMREEFMSTTQPSTLDLEAYRAAMLRSRSLGSTRPRSFTTQTCQSRAHAMYMSDPMRLIDLQTVPRGQDR